MLKNKIILGIDPGLATIGFGIISCNCQNNELLRFGTIKTAPQQIFIHRLEYIYKEVNKLIKKFKPHYAVCEELFFCKNVKTALAVSQARGVILLAIAHNKIPFYEFTPLEVKQTITGYGKADKKQMQKMIQLLLKLKKIPQSDDAADALAIALCAQQFINSPIYGNQK